MTPRLNQLSLDLRGESVTAEVRIYPPEHDVGIMGPYWEELTLFSETGTVLDWTLTPKEEEALSQAVSDFWYDDHIDDTYI